MYHSLYLSTVQICITILHCIPLPLIICILTLLSIYLATRITVHLPIHKWYTYLKKSTDLLNNVSLHIWLPIHLSSHVTSHLLKYLFIYLSVCPSIFFDIYLTTHPFTRLFIWFSHVFYKSFWSFTSVSAYLLYLSNQRSAYHYTSHCLLIHVSNYVFTL